MSPRIRPVDCVTVEVRESDIVWAARKGKSPIERAVGRLLVSGEWEAGVSGWQLFINNVNSGMCWPIPLPSEARGDDALEPSPFNFQLRVDPAIRSAFFNDNPIADDSALRDDAGFFKVSA